MPRSINRTEIEITGICKPFPVAIVIGQAGVGVTKPRCHVCVTVVTNRDNPKQEARIDVMRDLRAGDRGPLMMASLLFSARHILYAALSSDGATPIMLRHSPAPPLSGSRGNYA